MRDVDLKRWADEHGHGGDADICHRCKLASIYCECHLWSEDDKEDLGQEKEKEKMRVKDLQAILKEKT